MSSMTPNTLPQAGLEFWMSWQRQAALNMARAALLPMAAFGNMVQARAVPATGQREVEEQRDNAQARGPDSKSAPTGAKHQNGTGGSQSQNGGVTGPSQASGSLNNVLAQEVSTTVAALRKANQDLGGEFEKSAQAQMEATSKAGQALIETISESSQGFPSAAEDAARSLLRCIEEIDKAGASLSKALQAAAAEHRKAVGEITRELSRAARTGRQELQKAVKSAGAEIRQAAGSTATEVRRDGRKKARGTSVRKGNGSRTRRRASASA